MSDLRSEIELLEANVRAAAQAMREARETVKLLREERDGLADALRGTAGHISAELGYRPA